MADYERMVLDHYQLQFAFPTEWPAEKDLSDASDDEDVKPRRNGVIQKSKANRYSALGRTASDRRSLPGSQRTGDGLENLVQRDEPDPLGSTSSVVRTLQQQGLPIQDDPRLRNRFLLSSTTFSPALFLSQMHSTSSTQDLLAGLDILSSSIAQKSASLKVLVESNFERFVRAKATIDNVYTEMKYRGAPPPPSPGRTHSRHASRNSFRTSSGNQAIMAVPPPDKKKNALTKESEYGILGIKTPLLDVSAKAEELWGLALGGRDKEDHLKVVNSTVEKYKELYEVSTAITDGIKRKDYDSIIEEYTKARRFASDARKLVKSIGTSVPTDSQIHQILLASRVEADVEKQVEEFKRDVWRRLIGMQTVPSKSSNAVGLRQDQHMELIAFLLEVGVTDNPIWVWLLSRYDHLKSKIQTTSDRSRIEIEILRRKLSNSERPTPQMIAAQMRSLSRQTADDKSTSLDSSDTVELWEMMVAFLDSLLSPQGILGEVVEFWLTVQSFIDGKAQQNLPQGLNGRSREHHRLSTQGTIDLQKGTVELIDLIRENVFAFFADPPIEDISALFSPLPPNTPVSGGAGKTPTALLDPRFNFDPNNLPPPSPKRGEAWEKFAFWPPWSNSLSAVHYLAKMLVLVGSGASDMAKVSLIGQGDGSDMESLKMMVGGARERSVAAVCGAWNKDAENIKVLEDWRRSTEKRDQTMMPANFGSFESAILTGMQKILYMPEAMTRPGSEEVVLPPPVKLLVMVRSQFVTTLYKALSGLVENAEKTITKAEDDWTADTDGLTSPVARVSAMTVASGTVNASDRNIRMLLTLSNLKALQIDVVPSLTAQFENAFSVKLTEESKTIRDVLGQIDARLFKSYTRPFSDKLSLIIKTGVSSPTWPPPPTSKPKQAKDYIYECLLSLVLVHTQVSTTASSLAPEILTHLLEQMSYDLLVAFTSRKDYNLANLMQATLDVEFVSQTLAAYTSEKAAEYQSEIYKQLDKLTEDSARIKLQAELPGMRDVLKALRIGSQNEFACFRAAKSRRGAKRGVSGSTGSGRGSVGSAGRRETGSSGTGGAF